MPNKKEKGDSLVLKIIRGMNGLLENVILFSSLIVFVFSCYSLWDSNKMYEEANQEQYVVYKPSIDDQYSFDELRVLNPEVIGWIELYETKIDYPITQASDNVKYVSTNAMGEYSLSGSIFLDYHNKKDFSDFNNIMFGHHMEKQMMFGGIHLFSEEKYFQEHPYGALFHDGKKEGLELIAYMSVNAYDQRIYHPALSDPQEKENFFEIVETEAVHLRNVDLTIEDRLLVLSTCSTQTTDGRELLIYQIKDTVFDHSSK